MAKIQSKSIIFRFDIYAAYVPTAWIPFKIFPGFAFSFSVSVYCAGYLRFDFDRLDEIIDFTPGRSSTLTLKHYIKCYKLGSFQSFATNEKYNLAKVTCPLNIFYSDSDWAACEKDVKKIVDSLGSKQISQFKIEDFGHMDFLWDLKLCDIYLRPFIS